MSNRQLYQKLEQRHIEVARTGDEDLGPFKLLPGTWVNEEVSPGVGDGRGWNLIALPFGGARPPFRVLMNQYNESLTFSIVDKGVPNRGVVNDPDVNSTDQRIVTLDYEQAIRQVAAADFPVSGEAGGKGLAIHHEPGLFLHMLSHETEGIDIGRLAAIPHGDSVLGLGRSEVVEGLAPIPNNVTAIAVGVGDDIENNPYLAPYKHFRDNRFTGEVNAPGFPGFNPLNTTELLHAANQGVNVRRTTVLDFDTTLQRGGVLNIPFIVREANAASMKSTFWIQELEDQDEYGNPKLRMQYLQVVMLDFFVPRGDAMPGPIRWPHVSINTMVKVAEPRADMVRGILPSVS
ncbi:hypothetical protein J7376_05845 [Paracoccus sp. R12_1]|jgi:hypothetical protein|uniref:heme-binding protein n=1 Tax=unclassified Paracoccus (in: a-proteobacteria) TaxID=2688777 RepID=UPI001ADA3D49|nr:MULTISPECIES: heme-binding protein [unclassified Paracoccus (in: a-proteobacteria)]MBO9454482.1 hypothetical protein [Paracoccus sp. R12_2]MBO9486036.1 hypothetical protein [Paracoccus sp. R12_1]